MLTLITALEYILMITTMLGGIYIVYDLFFYEDD